MDDPDIEGARCDCRPLLLPMRAWWRILAPRSGAAWEHRINVPGPAEPLDELPMQMDSVARAPAAQRCAGELLVSGDVDACVVLKSYKRGVAASNLPTICHNSGRRRSKTRQFEGS